MIAQLAVSQCISVRYLNISSPSLVHPRHSLHSQALLVNGSSASTSELLAGALHDNRDALLVGEQTFGKGRTQRVIGLQDGSTLLVSSMQYLTPSHAAVDHVGLAPDVACRPKRVRSEYYNGGQVGGGSLLDDPCIKLASARLTSRT